MPLFQCNRSNLNKAYRLKILNEVLLRAIRTYTFSKKFQSSIALISNELPEKLVLCWGIVIFLLYD